MAFFAVPAPVLAAGGLTDINPGLTLWTGITFIVLLFVLGKFAWGPIVGKYSWGSGSCRIPASRTDASAPGSPQPSARRSAWAGGSSV